MDDNASQNSNQTPPQTPAAPQQPEPQPAPHQHEGLSHDTKTLIVILLLVFAYPIGIILMWVWMKTWKTIIKILVSVLPIILTLAWYILFFSIFFTTIKNTEDKSVSETITLESPTPTAFDQDSTPTPAASPSAAQDIIESSLSGKSYEDLIPYMAESVQFEIEASEGMPAGTPQETVENLKYLDTATPPWNFDQNEEAITSIKTQNAQEYGNLYIGIASNDVMAAFGYDSFGKINLIKVAVTYELLVTE